MPIVLTDSHAPIVIATLSGEVTDKEYAVHLAQFEAMSVARGRPYAYVYDATLGRSMPPTTRQIQADWIIAHKALIQKLCCGVAFVVGSAIQRGVLTAVHWLLPPPYTHAVYARRVEAINGVSSNCAPERSRCLPTLTVFAPGKQPRDVSGKCVASRPKLATRT